jgi:hypothetical protein
MAGGQAQLGDALMDILLERWATRGQWVELWRRDGLWSIYEYQHGQQTGACDVPTFEATRQRLDSLIRCALIDGINYKKVFDISTVEKQMEFHILRDGKYVPVDARNLLGMTAGTGGDKR